MQNRCIIPLKSSIWIIAVLFITVYPSLCLSIMIKERPSNVTVLEGSVATFRCGIVQKRSTDLISTDEFASVLTYNGKSTNGTKYTVDTYYTLTVKDITIDDEAWYECQAGQDRARARLSVNVMMTDMMLMWQDDPVYTNKSLVNLTCIVIYSRPPAEITWYHGDMEMTSLASSNNKTIDSDGFGNSSSTVTILVSSIDDTKPYQCVASLPNISVTRTEVAIAHIPFGHTNKCRRQSLNEVSKLALDHSNGHLCFTLKRITTDVSSEANTRNKTNKINEPHVMNTLYMAMICM
ncbi:Nephrosis 1 [Mactra antiquata]